MRINNNITALNSHRQYNINNGKLGKNVEKLSSGFRVNRAADDAAGLAISEKMRAQIRGLNMASKNSQDAISLVQTAEGGMQTIQDILQRVRELAVQSASDTNQDDIDREALDLEVQQLLKEVNQITDTTEFNKMRLMDGTYQAEPPLTFVNKEGDSVTGEPLTIQAGANEGQVMTITIRQLTLEGLQLTKITDADAKVIDGQISVTTRETAAYTISKIENALNTVSMQRAALGAFQNRLEFKVQNLNNQAENVAAAESRIRDADMAAMMTEFTKNNILFQSSTAMLAQANALPQSVLQLLG